MRKNSIKNTRVNAEVQRVNMSKKINVVMSGMETEE